MLDLLSRIKKQKPLVHHITNWVTIYDCANITRAIGALPVMAHAEEEVEEMASIASAVVLNIGTLTTNLVKSMILAAKKANEKGIPVVLDAVGVGATTLRTRKAEEILDSVKVSVLKGNASEIATLAGVEAETKGVEAMSVKGNPVEIARRLAKEKDLTVVITGKEDVISNSKKTYICKNGHPMLGSFVGTGCMVASVLGAFCAVEKDYSFASSLALCCFGIAGEIAATPVSSVKGPGSYKIRFFDEMSSIGSYSIERIAGMVKLEKLI
ncbi:MAG: hydroxyethylthiazole kinase [Actinobacteria bacterium]|nr:hydroxyethylthiazole kinase [Actinomycetota bacterium]